MTHYLKKPIVIKAVQWDGTYLQAKQLEAELELTSLGMTAHPPSNSVSWWKIATLEDGHVVSPMDWIITGVKGEHYPCKPDIFELTYEAAITQPKQTAPLESALHSLACRCLWIAYCWNEHNFSEAHTYARKTAQELGINNFDEANRWLVAQPEQTPDLQHVIETLIDHGNGKYKGTVSKAQRDKAIAICEALEHPANERNFCPRCGKRIIRIDDVHTCTPHAYKEIN